MASLESSRSDPSSHGETLRLEQLLQIARRNMVCRRNHRGVKRRIGEVGINEGLRAADYPNSRWAQLARCLFVECATDEIDDRVLEECTVGDPVIRPRQSPCRNGDTSEPAPLSAWILTAVAAGRRFCRFPLRVADSHLRWRTMADPP